MRGVLHVLAALSLAGCSASVDLTPTGNIEADLQRIAEFSLVDIDAAIADAKAHDDQAAMMCYPELRNFVVGLQAKAAAPEPVGALSAIQRKRDLLNLAQGGVPGPIRLHCAAWGLDELHQANQLLALLAKLGVGIAPLTVTP